MFWLSKPSEEKSDTDIVAEVPTLPLRKCALAYIYGARFLVPNNGKI